MMSTRRSTDTHTALITGASTGIGCALAKIFAQEGYSLVLIARHPDPLSKVAEELATRWGVSVRHITKDLSLPGAANDIAEELRRASVRIDVLVNNAGFGVHGMFLETDLKNELDMMQVNMVALTHLTKLLLRDMRERGAGKILNVASTAAFQPGPGMAVYYASKAYVLSFSQALAAELAGSGVTVTALCPGATQSAFQARAGMERTWLMSGGLMDADTVARIGYRGLMRQKTVVIAGLRNALFARLVRVMPVRLVTWVVSRLHRTREAPN